MKKIIGCWMLAVILLMGNTALADTTKMGERIEGKVTVGGCPMTVDALWEDHLPEPLMQTKIQQIRPSEKTIRQGLKKVFPDDSFSVQRQDAGFDFHRKSDKSSVFCLTDSCLPMEYALSWQRDDRLKNLISKCQQVMEAFQLEYDAVPVHASYFRTEDRTQTPIFPEEFTGAENEYVSIALSPSFLSVPLSHECLSELTMSTDDTPEVVSFRMAEFLFDGRGNVIRGRVPCFEVVKSRKMPGEGKTDWEKIARSTLERFLKRVELTATDDFYTQSTYETLKVKNMEELFEKYDVRLTRIRSVWLENWEGGLRPGWCSRVEIVDKSSGKWANIGSDTYYVPAVYIFGYEASGVSCQSFD